MCVKTQKIASLIGAWLLCASQAAAHPHIFVDAEATLVLNDAQSITQVIHRWTFDESFSAYATEGLDYNNNGTFDPDELDDLAEVNIDSLLDYAYFTFPADQDKVDALKTPEQKQSTWSKITSWFSSSDPEPRQPQLAYEKPTEYQLTFTDRKLTLEFTLPMLPAENADTPPLRDIAIFDPEFFVDYKFEGKDSISLKGAATNNCTVHFSGYTPLPQEILSKIEAVPMDQRKLPAELAQYTQDLSNTISLDCTQTLSGV